MFLYYSIVCHDTALCVYVQHYLLVDKRDPQAERDNVDLV